jgi:HEPN domain-containing protein
MKPNEIKEAIKYWGITAKRDFETMKGLFKIKRYPESLFYGHIVLEKILKAYVVASLKEQAPKIHDLVRLVNIAKLKLTEKEIDLLGKVNEFNLRSRYPDVKLNFYKIATKAYSRNYIEDVIKLYLKLCRNLKPKK